MNAIAELRSALDAERLALLTQDWRALDAAVARKEAVVPALATLRPAGDAERAQVVELRERTRHNMRLAQALARRVAEILAGPAGEVVYTSRAEVDATPSPRWRVTG